MSVAQQVNDLITSLRPAWICDNCIVEALGLTTSAYSAQITAALGTTSDFVRAEGICMTCHDRKMVIHAKKP